MECLECQCKNLIDVDDETSNGNKNFMCEDCGAEQTEIDWKFRAYKVGKVLNVSELKSPLKKCTISTGPDETIQTVTNAKHIAEGDMVVVATVGAIVPAGADPEDGEGVTVVKPTVVGGTKSDGMLCDGVMLQWAGGSKGVLVKLKADNFSVGDKPPARKPVNA